MRPASSNTSSVLDARAAAALGAITLGLAISVGIVVVATASEPPAEEGNLSNREMLVLLGENDIDPNDKYLPKVNCEFDFSFRSETPYYTSTSLIGIPCTSVRRMSRPLKW